MNTRSATMTVFWCFIILGFSWLCFACEVGSRAVAVETHENNNTGLDEGHDSDGDRDTETAVDSDSDSKTANGTDTDTDTDTDTRGLWPDLDSDGWLSEFDCDDENSDVNPGKEEIFDPPNGVDEDCDGFTDEEPEIYYDGCIVDFLFVIDNSSSMGPYQERLIESFPGFAKIVEDALGNGDFHVMVVDSTRWWNRCTLHVIYFGQKSCHEGFGEKCIFDGIDTCESKPTDCENTLGAGVTFPTFDPKSKNCNLAGGRRYITPETNDLTGKFSCIARVGTFGDGLERTIEELIGAIEHSRRGGCNAGFIRDDAILVVVIITDEDQRDALRARETLIQAKNGQEEGIVMMGFGAKIEIGKLIDSFPNSRRASLRSDYDVGLRNLLEPIKRSCYEYVP